ncbi:AlpA family transcriptional regulator [Acidocella sp. C78]|jgi:prophage regulatory protein|uniref:helix-turn-helix transcriptional regulator n=1 Tax=Acidocella sp. C78 TaxID=1671486 RepID=UPI00191B8F69|nr:AlpA family phage regulatory protein [Acidocella sp. C78]
MNRDTFPSVLLTIEDVMRLTGYKSRSSIYRLVHRSVCPPPVVIGGGRVRWRAGEIERWLQELPTRIYP